jgi:hypothetical protein
MFRLSFLGDRNASSMNRHARKHLLQRNLGELSFRQGAC